jgi:excisionase family DNA binding protein
MDKLLLRPAEVADLLGLGRTRVYALIGAKDIPSIKIGASVRVPLESLRDWIARQTAKNAGNELTT